MHRSFLSLISSVALTVSPAGIAAANSTLNLTLAYPRLVFDDNVSAAALVPDNSRRIVVAMQRGQLRILPADREAAEAPLFLDLRGKMKDETDFEEGMHGLAFHPDFLTNGRVYLSYSQRAPRRTVLSEFTLAKGADFHLDEGSERVILEYPHPLGGHWGGGVAFGLDGFLYMAIGDGGLRDDPYRLGQNLWSLHGKILRLDVNGRTAGLAYRIPPDNPHADRDEVRSEIWASGLRNPWGISFDKKTGTLWCGDVGQDAWEEVNLIKRGANYGWSERDGPARFSARIASPDEAGPYVDPIHSYSHHDGISITGGYVYRGKFLPSLHGRYIFGDWGVGKIWSLAWNSKDGSAKDVRLLYAKGSDQPGFNPTLIIPDANGEPLLFSHYPSVIYTLTGDTNLAAADDEEDAPEEAPESPSEEIQPLDGMVPDDTEPVSLLIS